MENRSIYTNYLNMHFYSLELMKAENSILAYIDLHLQLMQCLASCLYCVVMYYRDLKLYSYQEMSIIRRCPEKGISFPCWILC